MIDSSAPPQLACMTGYTFSEYCATTSYRDLLQCRYKEVNIPSDVQLTLSEFPDWLNWMIIVEDDVPDTLVILPILQRMVEYAPRSSIYILRADDDLSLIDSVFDELDLSEDDLLEAELPMLLLFNEEWDQLGQWGPRPRATESYLDQWLVQNPEFETLALSDDESDQETHAQLLDKLTYEMRVWYISDLDHKCCHEIHTLLESIVVEGEDVSAEDEDVSAVDEDTELEDEDMVDDAVNNRVTAESTEGSHRQNRDDASDADPATNRSSNNERRKGDRDKGNNQHTDRRTDNRKRSNSRRRSRPNNS